MVLQPGRDMFDRSGFFGPLGLPGSPGQSIRLDFARFRSPSTVTPGYSAMLLHF